MLCRFTLTSARLHGVRHVCPYIDVKRLYPTTRTWRTAWSDRGRSGAQLDPLNASIALTRAPPNFDQLSCTFPPSIRSTEDEPKWTAPPTPSAEFLLKVPFSTSSSTASREMHPPVAPFPRASFSEQTPFLNKDTREVPVTVSVAVPFPAYR